MRRIQFEENQRFTNWYVVIIVFLVIALMWYGFIQQIYFHIPFGTDPAPDRTLIILWMLFGVGFPIFFISIKLSTIVSEEGVIVRFRPFHLKRRVFLFSEMKAITVEKYRPLKEFLGYGIRFSFDGTTAYNIKGNKGIRIEMMDGKKILIGTQRAAEIDKLLQTIK